MSSNLANTYATLQRLYGDSIVLSYIPPPTYLRNIIGGEQAGDKVVVFHDEDRWKSKASNFISPAKLNINKSVDLDLTGSPLKDDCIVDAIEDMSLNNDTDIWAMGEECHKGLSRDKINSIVSTVQFQTACDGDSKPCQGSVWFLCNGADAEKTLLIQFEVMRDHFSRGIITFRDLVPALEVNTESLLQQHHALTWNNARVDTHVENTYHQKHNISFRCSWSSSATVPALIDLASCDVVLRQTFNLSSCGPLTQDLINQLRILTYIRSDILAYKQSKAADSGRDAIYRCGCGIDMDELRESVTKVLTEINGLTEINTESKDECNIEQVVDSSKGRRLNDLTDELWEILRLCSSYSDLKMGFNILFQCAARYNIVNTSTSKNSLAEIITALANRRLAVPRLTGCEPLELLLEIGLEKLYKDYEFIFTQSRISSASSLKIMWEQAQVEQDDTEVPNVRKSLRKAVSAETATPISNRKTLLHKIGKSKGSEDMVGFKNSSFDESESGLRLSKLLQLHCILEHVLMAHINLNLNSQIYSDICTQMLKRPMLRTGTDVLIDGVLKDKIEISLSPHDVREHLEGKDPDERRITMSSKNHFREIKSTFYYNKANVCPPSLSEHHKIDEKELIEKNTYYFWLYRKITSRNH